MLNYDISCRKLVYVDGGVIFLNPRIVGPLGFISVSLDGVESVVSTIFLDASPTSKLDDCGTLIIAQFVFVEENCCIPSRGQAIGNVHAPAGERACVWIHLKFSGRHPILSWGAQSSVDDSKAFGAFGGESLSGRESEGMSQHSCEPATGVATEKIKIDSRQGREEEGRYVQSRQNLGDWIPPIRKLIKCANSYTVIPEYDAKRKRARANDRAGMHSARSQRVWAWSTNFDSCSCNPSLEEICRRPHKPKRSQAGVSKRASRSRGIIFTLQWSDYWASQKSKLSTHSSVRSVRTRILGPPVAGSPCSAHTGRMNQLLRDDMKSTPQRSQSLQQAASRWSAVQRRIDWIRDCIG